MVVYQSQMARAAMKHVCADSGVAVGRVHADGGFRHVEAMAAVN